MADISVRLGNNADIPITITDSIGDPLDLTGKIVRILVKRTERDDDDVALADKWSYDASDIQITDAVGGKALLRFRIDEIEALGYNPTGFDYDIRVIGKRDVSANHSATVTAIAGEIVVDGANVDFTQVFEGSLIEKNGSSELAYITDIQGTDIVTSGFLGWASESFTADFWIGAAETPKGFDGKFKVLA